MAHKDTYPYKVNDSETMFLIVAPTAPKLADYMRPVRNKLQGSNQLAKPVKANEGLSEPESKPGQSAIAAEFQSKLLNCTRRSRHANKPLQACPIRNLTVAFLPASHRTLMKPWLNHGLCKT
jgi:hypothetical protein